MKRGFTLIEILATLILVSITGVLVGHLYAVTVGNYFAGVTSATRSQQHTVAQQRLIKEFNWAAPGSLTIAGGSSAEWQSRHPETGTGSARNLAFSSGTLTLNGQILLTELQSFSIAWDNEAVDLRIDNWDARIYPRRSP
jgi:prepilin-type N-terminal cleavage/methylation domain-containing protein